MERKAKGRKCWEAVLRNTSGYLRASLSRRRGCSAHTSILPEWAMLDFKKILCGQGLELSRLPETLLTSFQCLKSQWKPWDDMFFPLFVFDIHGAKRYKLFSAGPTTWQRTKEEIWQAKALLSELGIWPSTNSSVCPHQSLNTDKVSQINTSKKFLYK